MERKKEDIENRLKEIQRLLRQNTSVMEEKPPASKGIRRNQAATVQPPASEQRTQKPKFQAEQQQPQSIKEQLAQIRSLLVQTLQGQKRIEDELSNIRKCVAGSTHQYQSITADNAQTLLKSGISYQQRSSLPIDDQQSQYQQQGQISILQNFRNQTNKFY